MTQSVTAYSTGVNAPGVIVRTPFTMPGPAKEVPISGYIPRGLSLEALGSCFCPTLPPMFSFMVVVGSVEVEIGTVVVTVISEVIVIGQRVKLFQRYRSDKDNLKIRSILPPHCHRLC